jgi:hypothetical protein
MNIKSKRTLPRRVWIRLFLATTLIVGVTYRVVYLYYTAPPPGYCESKGFVPDEVFIEKALADSDKGYRKFDGKNYSVLSCCLLYRMEGTFFSKLLHQDEGVWVEFAYERNELGIERLWQYDHKKNGVAISYFDSCANSKAVTEDTRGPGIFGYTIRDKDEMPVLDKHDIKYFVKWPK